MIKYVLLIIAIIVVYICGVAVGRRIERFNKIETVGTIYVNPDATRDEPSFRCAVTPEFIDTAFGSVLNQDRTHYVIFELKEDNINEDSSMWEH